MDGATWSMGQSRRHSSCPRPSLPCHLTQPAFDPSCPAPRSQRLCWRPTSPVAALGSLPSFGPCEWSHPSWPPGFGPKNTSGGVTTVPCKWKFSIAQWPLRRGTQRPHMDRSTKVAHRDSDGIPVTLLDYAPWDPLLSVAWLPGPFLRGASPDEKQFLMPILRDMCEGQTQEFSGGFRWVFGGFEGPWNGHGHPFPKPNPTL